MQANIKLFNILLEFHLNTLFVFSMLYLLLQFCNHHTHTNCQALSQSIWRTTLVDLIHLRFRSWIYW